MRIPTLLLPLLFAASLHAAVIPDPKGTRAVFDISNEVVVANPPRFGANIEPPSMSHWSTEPWHNQWWSAPAIEPITARLKGTASGGDNLTLDANDGSRIGYYDVFRDGFFNGGTAQVYRYADGKMTLVRDGTIATYQAAKGGVNRVTFTEPGPVVKAGDEYVISVERMDVPPGTTRTWDANPLWLLSGYQFAQGKAKLFQEAGVRVALAADPASGGGRASLKLTIPAGLTETPLLGNWLLSGQQPDYPRLREGKTYTVSLWLKQSGMARPEAEVRVAYLKTATLRPTTEWKEYRVEFVGAPPPDKMPHRFEIGSREPGDLYIDRVSITENDGPANQGFYPEIIDTLKRFQPSTLRIWALQQNRGFGIRLDDVLGPRDESNVTFRELNGAQSTIHVGLHQELELCVKTGANPWIITSTMFSPEENRNLIEYLAGPADSPYGKKRAAWGQVKPWTEVFGNIDIEPGNEVWNRMFAPQHFSGRPDIYGAYAEQIFQTMKSSPYYQADKFKFIVNGWSANTGMKGFGARALINAPSADAFDIAYYTGGWDAVGVMKADNETESWMNILTYSRRILMPRSLLAKETADAIGKQRGRPAAVMVYEAGPGYTLPAPGKFNLAEQREGKSMAQAINSLDIFMTNLRAGFGDQSFFMFRNGHYWSSHNRTWGEHIAWKALGMRNSLLKGDLITAAASEMVTIDLPESEADVLSQANSADKKVKKFPAVPGMPLIDCYAFRDGNRYATMLISRRLDGPTPVTLNLPYDPKASYSVHALTADSPAAHNIDEELVKVKTYTYDTGMTRSFTLQVPPHSVVVVQTEAK